MKKGISISVIKDIVVAKAKLNNITVAHEARRWPA